MLSARDLKLKRIGYGVQVSKFARPPRRLAGVPAPVAVGILLAGGQGGIIYSLDNGDTWAACTGTTPTDCRGIAFHNGLFVAAGLNRISKSTDGINWTSVSELEITSTGVVYNPVAGYWFVSGGPNSCLYSYDLITWTTSGSGDDDIYNAVAITPNYIMIAMTNNGVLYQYPIVEAFPNRDNGSYVNIADFQAPCFNIQYVNNTIVACGDNAHGARGALAYSTDNGATWASTPLDYTYGTQVFKVIYGGGKWVAAGSFPDDNEAMVFTTTDITSNVWNRRFMDSGNRCVDVAYNNGIYTTATLGGLYTSSDAVTWTRNPETPNDLPFNRLNTFNGRLFAGAQNGVWVDYEYKPSSNLIDNIYCFAAN